MTVIWFKDNGIFRNVSGSGSSNPYFLYADYYAEDVYNNQHDVTGVNCSGVNSYLVTTSHNRNPAVQFTRIDVIGNSTTTMTLLDEEINANVCSTQVYGLAINEDALTVRTIMPGYHMQGMMVLAVRNINQTTPTVATSTSVAWGTSATINYTGTLGNLIVVAVSTQNSRTPTIVGLSPIIGLEHPGGEIGSMMAGYTIATGSSQTLGMSYDTGDNYVITLIEFAKP